MRIRRWLDYRARGIKVWHPSNVYPTAKIGDRVSVGMFSEIGHNVEIGADTRIGMGAFIPEGVTIGKNCFIGPRVCMVNDRQMQTPPYSSNYKQAWEKIIIEDFVKIGANVMILTGVTVGMGAVIGMGSVLTKSVEPFEVWCGNPARKIRNLIKEDFNG